jgi:Phosphatidylinositol N-acetylglucosaminyltransferase
MLVWRPRCTHGQGVPAHLPRTHSPCSHPPDSHGAHVHRLDLGPHDGTLPRTRCARGLLVRCVSGPTRAVRVSFSFFDADKYDPPGWKRLTSVLSINAAISAAVVLASRLHDDLAVFALMLFSVEAFALFPIFRRRIQVCPILTCVMPMFTHTWTAVDACSGSIPCYATIGVGSSGGTITHAL